MGKCTAAALLTLTAFGTIGAQAQVAEYIQYTCKGTNGKDLSAGLGRLEQPITPSSSGFTLAVRKVVAKKVFSENFPQCSRHYLGHDVIDSRTSKKVTPYWKRGIEYEIIETETTTKVRYALKQKEANVYLATLSEGVEYLNCHKLDVKRSFASREALLASDYFSIRLVMDKCDDAGHRPGETYTLRESCTIDTGKPKWPGQSGEVCVRSSKPKGFVPSYCERNIEPGCFLDELK